MAAASPAVLALFWDLASVDANKRLEASSSLVGILTEAQGSDTEPCGDLAYTVRRLVRGLASSRDGARQGFGAALIEVLRVLGDAVELEGVLSIMADSMALHGSMHGAEERDALFGRVFTCAAILRCGRLGALAPKRRLALATSISRELAFCAAKKTFLHELCAVLQCELVDSLAVDEVHGAVWPQIAPLLAVPLAEWSAHALLLGLRLSRRLPTATLATLLPHVSLSNGQLFSLTNLPALVAPLKAASIAHPHLHAVWDAVFEHGLRATPTNGAAAPATDEPATSTDGTSGKKSKKAKKAAAAAAAAGTAHAEGTNGVGAPPAAVDDGLLRAFWQTVVEEGLVPSTLERKYMSFLLLQRALTALGPAQVPLLLSPALLRCLVNALEGTDRLLRPAATATLSALATAAESSPTLRPALVSGLLGRGRGGEYDRLTSTKALRQLLTTAPSLAVGGEGDGESLSYLFSFFASGHAADETGSAAARRAIAGGEDEGEVAAKQRDASRVWALDQLLVLARSALHRGKHAGGAPAAAADGDDAPDADADAELQSAASARGAVAPTLPLRTLRFLLTTAFWQLPHDGSTKAAALVHDLGGVAQPPPSVSVRRACAERLLSILGESCTATLASAAAASGGGREQRGGVDESESGLEVLEHIGTWWAELSAAGATLITPLSGTEEAALKSSRALVDSLRQRRRAPVEPAPAAGGHGRKLRALEVFARHMQIQMLVGTRGAAGALDELSECVREVDAAALRAAGGGAPNGKASGKRNGKVSTANGTEGEKPHVSEVIVDLVLSVMVQPSATLRDVGKTVIRAFGDEMGEGALGLLVDVLRATPEEAANDDDDDDDDEDDDEDDDDDVEEVDGEEDEDEDDEDEEDDDEEEGEEEYAEAMKLAHALQKAAGIGGGGDEEDEEDEVDEEMPEDPREMAAVDKQLAAMLRLRMEQQQEKKERSQQNLHFKQRVLDLLEALAKRANPPPSLLLLPLPLLKLLASVAAKPAERPLLERATGLLRNRLAKLTIRPPWPHDAVSAQRLLDELTALVGLAERMRAGGNVAAALSDCVLMLLRTMSQHKLTGATGAPAGAPAPAETAVKGKKRAVHDVDGLAAAGANGGASGGASGELTAGVLELLEGAYTRFYTQKNCRLHTKLLGEILKRQPAIGWLVAPTVVSHISAGRDSYLCGEACAHVEMLVQQHAHHAKASGSSPLVPLLPALCTQLGALLSKPGVRAKHLLPPLKLAHALLRTVRTVPQADAKPLAAALASAIEAMRATQGGAARSIHTQSQKVLSLVAQIQADGSGAGGAGGGKKRKGDGAHKSK